ncbi:FAD-binding oxidoreductase [Primorskyibacter sp. S187A]|uniref:FAD-binding oxidoreductase n=1 Tax=Primorskyibacter sp. S187A TaxID=3415130 RepID=UPI003C7C5911
MPRDISTDIPQTLAALEQVLGDRLSRSKPDLENHGRSESYFPLTLPHAVAYPTTTAEVSHIARICSEYRCPLVGWGTGTSVEGHALAIEGGVVLDFSKMAAIRSFYLEDMCVTVEPGLTREALNAELRDSGLFFPVDPGANASLGGMAMTRASGTTAVRYGTMRDNVLGMEVVLADGRVIETGSRARKSSAGYDMTALMVGSEGTLGLCTGLTLRLHGQPESVAAAVCSFSNLHAAVAAVQDTIQMGLPMARIEFVDSATAAAVNDYAGVSFPLTPHLLVEFHGTESGVAEQAERFGDIIADHGATGFEWSTRPEDRTALWTMRYNALYAIKAMRPGARALVTDVCVPISQLARAVEETQADLARASIPAPILGHVGDGNFHAILLVDPTQPAEFEEAKRLSDAMTNRALALGGTSTGEHGVGMGKLGFMEREHGDAWAIMGALKDTLDPLGILNPGKLVPPKSRLTS